MKNITDIAKFMYGDTNSAEGFWYSHVLYSIEDLSDEQLFWVPDANNLCLLWHAGHIAHRERLHIGKFLQGIKDDLIPEKYEVFGAEWKSVDEVMESIDSCDNVRKWVQEVRSESQKYISTLEDSDLTRVTETSEFNMSIGHWLFITACHTALHFGKIQLLRAMMEKDLDSPC